MRPEDTAVDGRDPRGRRVEPPAVKLHQRGDRYAALVGATAGAWLEASRSAFVAVRR